MKKKTTTRPLKLENVSMQGGIITADCLTPGIKVKGHITLRVNEETKVECVVIKKIGKQIKARVIKVYAKQESAKITDEMQGAKNINTQEIAVPAGARL